MAGACTAGSRVDACSRPAARRVATRSPLSRAERPSPDGRGSAPPEAPAGEDAGADAEAPASVGIVLGPGEDAGAAGTGVATGLPGAEAIAAAGAATGAGTAAAAGAGVGPGAGALGVSDGGRKRSGSRYPCSLAASRTPRW